jgi:hypothetical protein
MTAATAFNETMGRAQHHRRGTTQLTPQTRAEERSVFTNAGTGPRSNKRAQRSGPFGPHVAKRAGAGRGAPATNEWSGKRDSNPRLRPWQGRTLPLSYSRSRTPKVPHGRVLQQGEHSRTGAGGWRSDAGGRNRVTSAGKLWAIRAWCEAHRRAQRPHETAYQPRLASMGASPRACFGKTSEQRVTRTPGGVYNSVSSVSSGQVKHRFGVPDGDEHARALQRTLSMFVCRNTVVWFRQSAFWFGSSAQPQNAHCELIASSASDARCTSRG